MTLPPVNVVINKISAYTCKEPAKRSNGEQASDSESFEEITESDLMELQAHKSPVSETSDTLTYGSLDSQLENDQKEEKIDLPPDFLQKYVLGNNISITHNTKYVST